MCCAIPLYRTHVPREIACGRTQAIADLSQENTVCELAEDHTHRMLPPCEVFAMFVYLKLCQEILNQGARQQANNSGEWAYILYSSEFVFVIGQG